MSTAMWRVVDGERIEPLAIRTWQQVADILAARGDGQITRTRVYQIEKRALAKLRVALADLESEAGD